MKYPITNKVNDRLQVWIDAADAAAGPVAEVAPGETVGEISLLTGGPRSASIRAVRDSLLLRMDAALDRLGHQRPALIRQLAGGIATRLRQRTGAGHGVSRRSPRTIALLPLDDAAALESAAARLAQALGSRGPAIVVSAARLRDLGAPALPASAADSPSAAMADWLATLEDDHRFLLLPADAGDTPWSRLALRHADLVLRVAHARREPGLRPWECSFLGPGDRP